MTHCKENERVLDLSSSANIDCSSTLRHPNRTGSKGARSTHYRLRETIINNRDNRFVRSTDGQRQKQTATNDRYTSMFGMSLLPELILSSVSFRLSLLLSHKGDSTRRKVKPQLQDANQAQKDASDDANDNRIAPRCK